jgi:hypothetical protein
LGGLGESFISQSSNLSTAVPYYSKKNYFKNISIPADTHPKINEPFSSHRNPLIIKAILHFCLLVNKFDNSDEEISKILPLDPSKILDCKSLREVFVMALNHFRFWIFSAHQLNSTG